HRMLFVLIVQRVDHRHRHLGLPRIARRRCLLPKPVCAAQVQKVVAADAGVRWNDSEGCQPGEGLREGVGCCAVVIKRCFTIKPVLPFPTESCVEFEARCSAESCSSERLADLLIAVIRKPTEPMSCQNFNACFSAINIRRPWVIEEERSSRRSWLRVNKVREMIEKQVSTQPYAVSKKPALILCLIRNDFFRLEVRSRPKSNG